jgi:para-aminobenzoate synthetase component I
MLQNSSSHTLAHLFDELSGVLPHSQLWRPLELSISPSDLASQMADLEGFVWLDSSMDQEGAVSFLTAQPTSVLFGHIDRDWAKVESTLQQAMSEGKTGGLFGFVGFHGHFHLGLYPAVLKFQHDTQQWFEMGHFHLPPIKPCAQKHARQALSFTPLVSRSEFMDLVKRAQDYIAQGDIYQVNLSHPWRADWKAGSPTLALYEHLRKTSPAPHAAYFQLGHTSVLSASPELFLKMSGRTIMTRPIKGTRPRFPDDMHRDAQSARDLLACDKERAELLMITDLERNDLGQVCEFGSVQTPDLWRVESFAQVYHLVSTVTGKLRPEISHAAAFRACFPGGSISGAPKKRALEIIAELETHPRGLYTGAMGYFGFDGTSQWNIAIRTAVQHHNKISFHVGSGIVADSIPEREWEETLHKASGLLKAWA